VAVIGYCIVKGGLFAYPLSEQEAAALFRSRGACCESELAGDLETGFCFWTTVWTDAGVLLKLVRCVVKPVPGCRVEWAAEGGPGSAVSD
jgi:hypothetical protein